MKIQNMTSTRSGNPVVNQFDISHDHKNYFQSYDSLIACYDRQSGVLTLGRDWDYSNTTKKYLHQWLDEHFLNAKFLCFPGKSFGEIISNGIKAGKIVYDEKMF